LHNNSKTRYIIDSFKTYLYMIATLQYIALSYCSSRNTGLTLDIM